MVNFGFLITLLHLHSLQAIVFILKEKNLTRVSKESGKVDKKSSDHLQCAADF